jgi:LacI family transcriptional regulator
VLLFPVDATYRDPVLLQNLADGFPVVLVDHYVQGIEVDYVVSDGYGGMVRAVQHLLGLGHTNIGFVTWDVNRAGETGRYLGYQQALREWGVEPSRHLVCLVEDYPSEDLSPLIDFLSGPHCPTAVVTLNDYLAIQVTKVCRKLGLLVPQQLAVVGFDDIDIAAQMEVPLTTVSQPIHEIGAQAVRLLYAKFQDPTQECKRIILPTHLVIRESCGINLAARQNQ